MKNRLFHITLLIILCFSISSRAFSADICKDSVETEISSHDVADSGLDCDISCDCHHHHHHFDFAVLSSVFVPITVKSINLQVNLTSFFPSLNFSQKRPPKLVS